MRKMNLNENAYTAGERQFVLYEYLRRNATKDHVVSKQDLLDELQRNGIIVHENTPFTDLGILGGKVFGLQLEYDRSKKGYWITNPEFKPSELSLMVDSIQASKFITKKQLLL